MQRKTSAVNPPFRARNRPIPSRVLAAHPRRSCFDARADPRRFPHRPVKRRPARESYFAHPPQCLAPYHNLEP